MIRANALVALGAFSFLAQRAEQPSAQESLSAIQHLLQSGDVKRAGELATELVRTHPDSEAVYEALGRVRDEEGRYGEADAAYQHAIKLAPSAAAPHVSLGVSYVRRGLTQQALQQFRGRSGERAKELRGIAERSKSRAGVPSGLWMPKISTAAQPKWPPPNLSPCSALPPRLSRRATRI